MTAFFLAATLVASYLAGCFMGAYYVGRWRRGTDIRLAGSGNAGARNMARVHGLGDAALVFVIDAGKGALVAWAAWHLMRTEWAAAAALLSAIVGHIWPAHLGFRGGKGAATGLGGMLVLDLIALLGLLAVGAVALAITRRFTPSGLVAIALAAPALALTDHGMVTVSIVAVASALCLVAHHPWLDGRRRPAAPSPR